MSKGFLLTLWITAVVQPALGEETNSRNLGKRAADFTLKDTAGKPMALKDFKDKKAVVVIFLGTECPINNAFLPTLAALHQEYSAKGVQFLAINANQHDSEKAIADHAKKFRIPFPVLKDEGNKVADQLQARRTPEVFLLDGERKIRYQGRIDDQFGIGFKRGKPTRRDLAEALDEMLAGKPVTLATTPVAGCLIARPLPVKEKGKITFAKDVAPILQKNCQECHRPGQIGPMALLTYKDASAWAETIREVIEEDRMPPWPADPRYGKFLNDRRLPKESRDTLLAWIDQGLAKGEDKDLPPPRKFTEGWTIGEPDMIFTMPKEFEVPAAMPKYGVPYQHFFVDTDFKEDRWVVAAEAKAGAPEVVHHIVVFVVPPKVRFFPGSPNTPALAGIAPGDIALTLQPGFAKKIPAGSKLVFQMHYTPNGKAYKDKSTLGVIFAKEPPKYQVLTFPIANPTFKIPAGADHHEVEAWFTFKEDGLIVAFMPHMHLRGKDFLIEGVMPDGRKETLLSVPRYNFNWQSTYRLAEPKAMPKGSKVHCVAHFDNSANNPNNPDPLKPVFWGDQTWEEMMIGWIDFVYKNKN